MANDGQIPKNSNGGDRSGVGYRPGLRDAGCSMFGVVVMNLTLNLKGKYFDAIKVGNKPEEYRLCNAYWTKRLVGREYENIIVKRGYPARHETEKQIVRPWRGYVEKMITHPHFGDAPVKVYAIDVR